MNLRVRIILYSILFILFFSQQTFCQNSYNPVAEASDTTRSYNLDPVVVTGTRMQQEKSKIPASISIIDRNMIESSEKSNALNVMDSRIPGLFINNRSLLGFGAGPASAGNISMRGISGSPNNRVLILIDGQIQFMGMFGHPFPDAYLSSDIERIEVIRGPASILYGENAFAGAINFITRKQTEDKLSIASKLSYGSFNSKEVSLNTGYKKNNFNLLVSLNNSFSAGHRTDGEDKFKTNSAYLNTGYIFNQYLRMSLDGNISDSRYYDPGTVSNPRLNDYYNYLRTRVAFSLDNSFEAIEGALRLFYNYGKHAFFDGWNSKDYTSGITFYQSLKVIRNSVITIGFDYKNYGGKGTNVLIPFPLKGLGTSHWLDEKELYLMWQHIFFSDLILNAGYRFTNNSLFGNENTPQAGFSFIASENTIIKGSVGKAFRSPTILDLYLYPVSNINLKPEKLVNYELGINQYFFQKKIYFELTGFYNEGSNIILISSPVQGVPPFRNNSGKFRNRGIEFQNISKISNSLNLFVTYSFINSDVAMRYVPEHQLNFEVEYSYKLLTISSNVKRIENLYSDDVNRVKESYTKVDADISYKFFSWINAYFRAENIFNESYQIDLGYPSPGRSFMMGIAVHN